MRASLADAQVRAEELRNRLASARFDLANSEVRAPVAGLVVGQEVFTEGGVIAPGQQLMEILPERQPLLVDARLPVEMVDKVRVGLPVELMFSAFNQSTTPRVEGEVTLVSADRLLDERSEAPYYRVRIRVGEEGVRRLAGLEIRPGMPVEAFVRSGERSLLNYLFKPLADRTHLALGGRMNRLRACLLSSALLGLFGPGAGAAGRHQLAVRHDRPSGRRSTSAAPATKAAPSAVCGHRCRSALRLQ